MPLNDSQLPTERGPGVHSPTGEQTGTPRTNTTQTPPGEATDISSGTVAQHSGDLARAQALSATDERDKALSKAGKERTEGQSESARVKALRLSQNIPGYKLIEKLGEGTFGVVFRAREDKTGIEVAIKFFAHGTGLQWHLLQAEVKQLANLQADPGIVQLKDVVAETSPPFYVMALAERGCLARLLRQKDTLPVHEALAIFRQVVETMAYVHAKGIRHCDLKPGNILLDARGRARVADFGQAHLSSDATPALGTFFYMAPEQADLESQIPDTRWDVYSLGALFHSMVTGHPPRQNPAIRDELANTAELSHRLKRYRDWVQNAPPTEHRNVPGMDRELADIIDRCLEIDPEKRLRDAGAILDALAQREWKKKQKPLIVFGFIAPLLLVLAMAGFAFWITNEVLGRTNSALVDQRLQANQHIARLVGGEVEIRLEKRLERLKRDAADPALVAGTRKRSLVEMRAALEKLRQKQLDADLFRWTVTDPSGTIIANYPADDRIVGINYSWRDWFNGTGDKPEEKGKPHLPKARPHISQPYIGTSKGNKFSIGLSTAIEDEKDLVGIVLLTVDLEEFGAWLSGNVEVGEGFVALVNERRHLLLHKNLDKIKPDDQDHVPRWDSLPIYTRLKADPDARQHEEYVDPVDGKTYLAGFVPIEVNGSKWWAIVQHQRGSVLKPIEDLRQAMTRIAVVSLIAVGALMSVLWGWLIRRWRRGERLSHA